ncbi:MAG: transglutaminase N-terminal domain-containing protein [Candidatus Binataceae bacterium]|jgi:transglutaminase-like putative cysteine protease
MPTLTIKHTTIYRYRQPLGFGEHRTMLRPLQSHDQRVVDAKLVISPPPTNIRRGLDAFANHVDIVPFAGRAREPRFDSTIRSSTYVRMAAQFISGYLHIPDDDGERYVGGGNTHAWVQVHLPGPGWVDFDSSNGAWFGSRWCAIRAM